MFHNFANDFFLELFMFWKDCLCDDQGKAKYLRQTRKLLKYLREHLQKYHQNIYFSGKNYQNIFFLLFRPKDRK